MFRVMQSSECGFNEKYPRVHNGITDADYSIKVGIQHLASCLNDAKVSGRRAIIDVGKDHMK